MVDITEISAIVAAAGVLVGVIYYMLDIRSQAKLRQTDMVMKLYATYGSMEFQEAYQKATILEYEDFKDYWKKYSTDIEVRAALTSVGVFFEGIGVLVRRKLINMDLVDDLFSNVILRTWKKMEPIAKGLRELQKSPSTAEWFEYLYNEMKKREQQPASRTA